MHLEIPLKTKPTFTSLDKATPDELHQISDRFGVFANSLADRILAHLQLLADLDTGFSVDRLTHSLQSATLAYEAGEREEYVVCALLHDIGDSLGSYSHADIAAAILKPFVSEENWWIVQHHAIFQGYHFFHRMGRDRNLRDRFRGHPYFDSTARFCKLYDTPAFVPQKPCMAIADFAPMVRNVFLQPKHPVVNPWMSQDSNYN